MDDGTLLAEVNAAMDSLAETGLDRGQQRDVILGMIVRWAAAGEGLPPDCLTAEAHAGEFARMIVLAIRAGIFSAPRAGFS